MTTINLYHKWAYIDEICAALESNTEQLSLELGLPVTAIKVVRALIFLDELTLFIFNSFCHPDHPPQVDNFKKLQWIISLRRDLKSWHQLLRDILKDAMANVPTSRNVPFANWVFNSNIQQSHLHSHYQRPQPQQPSIVTFLPLCPQFLHPDFRPQHQKILHLLHTQTQKHVLVLAPWLSQTATAATTTTAGHEGGDVTWITIWNRLKTKLVDERFVLSILNDTHLHPVKEKYSFIEPFFRGIHQTFEIVLHIMLDLYEEIQLGLKKLRDVLTITVSLSQQPQYDLQHQQQQQPQDLAARVRNKLSIMKGLWEQSAAHVLLLTQMDTGSYQEYRQALLGTSGGDSKQLRALKHLISNLHLLLLPPSATQKHQETATRSLLVSSLLRNSNHPMLNQLLSSVREVQCLSTNFWLCHFTLAANTIGMIKGSQGLPVPNLVALALRPLLEQSSLLYVVGGVGEHYESMPQAKVVKFKDINNNSNNSNNTNNNSSSNDNSEDSNSDSNNYAISNKKKVLGDTIYAHVQQHCHIVHNTYHPGPPVHAVLDNFVLRPLEVSDTHASPYAKWFNPDTTSLRFEMHSYGTPLYFFNESCEATAARLLEHQNDYWEVFFGPRIKMFTDVLFHTLNITQPNKNNSSNIDISNTSNNNSSHFAVSVDINITALLERLLSSIPSTSTPGTILTTDQEFVAINRALIPRLSELGSAEKLEVLPILPTDQNIDDIIICGIQKVLGNSGGSGSRLKLVIFPQVMSNSQISLSEPELVRVLAHVPANVPVIIDATQGLFNVPVNWGKVLGDYNNVYVLGSAIKHGRSTSGLGFLIHPKKERSLLNHPRKTGWCAYLSGLSSGTSLNSKGDLGYDDEWQWFGGTPGNIFAMELFINTWDAILRAQQSVKTMHQYVQSLHRYFFELLKEKGLVSSPPHHNDIIAVLDVARRTKYPQFASNTLVVSLPSATAATTVQQHAQQQRVHFDVRKGSLLRLGFGVQHSRRDVEKLVRVLAVASSAPTMSQTAATVAVIAPTTTAATTATCPYAKL